MMRPIRNARDRRLGDLSIPAFLLAAILAPASLPAATPQAIKVQGSLTDRVSGTPMPAQGTFNMSFAVWDSEFGGVRVTSIGPLAVDVVQGRFQAELPFSTPQFQTAERYLEITVNGELLSPRLRLVSTPFAFLADMSVSASTAGTADLALTVAPGSVGPAAILPGAVGPQALAPGSVTSDKLAFPCAIGEILVRGPYGWDCATNAICAQGSYIGCYTGPSGTLNVGRCRPGTSPCNATGTAFEGCNGQVLPVPEICDGADNDCDGEVDENNICSCPDADGDGYPDRACGGTDCLDTNPAVHPGATEICDHQDDDCNGVLPANEQDADGDGFMACAGDCLDNNAAIHPGAPELCDGIDIDCDVLTLDCIGDPRYGLPCDGPDTDLCLEGVWICAGASGMVCTDTTGNNIEICDGVDNDCNGVVDDGLICTCPDADGDGYPPVACGGTDCVDTNPAIHPDAPELCDGINNDCDASTPDGIGDPRFATPCSSPTCPTGTWICGTNPVTHVVEMVCAC
jgi:hypothetical protein